MLIYIAHPIDRANQHNRTKISGALAALGGGRAHLNGNHMYIPSAAFKLGPGCQPDTTINNINAVALDQAPAVLALWPSDAKSWGVPIEVDRAVHNGKRVALVVEEEPTWAMAYPADNVHYFKANPWEYDPFTMATLRAMDWLTGTERELKTVYKPRVDGWARGFLQDDAPAPATETASEGLGEPQTDERPEKDDEVTEGTKEAPRDIIGFRDLQGDKFEDAHVSLPTRGYKTDAGLDIYVSEDTIVEPHTFADVRSHTAVNLPDGYWGYLVGRSSTLRKKGLLVNPGVIDNGYTGELYSAVWNLTSNPVKIHAGERVAQLILVPNITPNFDPQWVDSAVESERGDQGFGSSGV